MELNMALMCEKLRSRGHDVYPVCSFPSAIYTYLTKAGFKPFILNLRHYLHPFWIAKLVRYLNEYDFDLIHADYSRDLWTIVPALKLTRKKIPLVLIKHIGTMNPKRDLFHREIYRNVDFIIAISNVIRNNVIATHPISASKVRVIHHGVDFSRFRRTESGRDSVRNEFQIEAHEILIGIVGRLQAAKGHFEFIEMAKSLVEKFPQVKFIVVGEATRGEESEAQKIQSAAYKTGLGERMILSGYRQDVPNLFAAMDIFVFPSHAEAFGLVLIEAMGMKLPVVSSNCDGVLDIVVDQETGFLVPPKNVPALIEAVEILITDEKLRRKMGEAGFVRARFLFEESKMLDELETLYAGLIQNKVE